MYTSSPELRIMNETAASIAETEIGQAFIRQFYPNLLESSPLKPRTFYTSKPNPSQPYQHFDFSKEMYQTRVHVDELLKMNKIEQAEQYMELRRIFFWENGYPIRKLNQAYFAFHGAYADKPYSAAGADPVGDDVRLFRTRQPSLDAFVRKMSWMFNYAQLRAAARAF